MSTMLYNGTELPALPHWDGMPPDYQFIFLSGGYYYLAGTNSAPFCVLVSGADRVTLRADVIFTAFEARAGAESWGTLAYSAAPFASLTDEGYVFNEAITFIWTQKDIPSATEGEVYLAGTEPTEPEAEEDPMIMFRRGWMDGFLTGLTARGLLRRRTVEEPAEIFYLYGTPSPTIVTYNGVELPELPEWDKSKYPYAYITQKSSGAYSFTCLQKPMEYGYYGETTTGETVYYARLNICILPGTIGKILQFALSENAWGEAKETTIDQTTETVNYYALFTAAAWSNTDVQDITDNTTYLAASDPVYTNSGNVALADGEGYVLYKAAVLPKLPEWDMEAYPYATIVYSSTKGYVLGASSVVTKAGSTGLVTLQVQFLRWNVVDGQWTKFGISDMTTSTTGTPIFANYDLYNSDGTAVTVPASDPIPLTSSEPVAAVYEGIKWNVRTYPYAVETYRDTTDGRVRYFFAHEYQNYFSKSVFGVPFYYYGSNDGVPKAVLYMTQPDGVDWVLQDETAWNISTDPDAADVAIWSNFDLKYTDGSTNVAASEPLLIYEKKE